MEIIFPLTSHYTKTQVLVFNNLLRSKMPWPNMVNFTVYLAGHRHTGYVWWEGAQSRFQVDLKSNFALKNNSMEFLLGPIIRRINVMYESRMKWTWHHSKLTVEEVSFFGRLKSGTPSTNIYAWWSSRRYRLGRHAPNWSTLLQLHLHSRLNTWLQWIGQRQLQDETRIKSHTDEKFCDLVWLILEILQYV